MKENTYYILRIKGKAKIPDYIQVRDSDFTLIGYFRPGRDERILATLGTDDAVNKLKAAIVDLDYGKIQKVEL
ncbi:MAG: fructose-6-phosphate aldolase [Bacteroidia bacterium]|nr:fructose-6-phosphate aldolase [Bacteroidia bacterium]